MPAADQGANARLWSRTDLVSDYASRDLRPVEIVLLARYRDELSGRVLELGCGAGRFTGYLVALGGDVVGLDVSPAMLAHCRQRYPGGTFVQGDLCDLSRFPDGSRDAVLIMYNTLDVVGHEERGRVLDAVRRVLAPGGTLIMSSHNRAAKIRTPTQVRWHSPPRAALDLLQLPRNLRNRRRVLPLEHVEEDWALLNDVSHNFEAIHYYVTRDAHARRLADHGFDLVECLDLEGSTVGEGQTAPECSELHYVAQKDRFAPLASAAAAA